jgi:Fe/S biogenesis protein NfuA
MITFSDVAKQKVREYMDQSETECIGLRVMADRQGRHHFRYNLALLGEGDARDDDIALDQGSFTAYVDPATADMLDGTAIDFVSDFSGAGFRFDNPHAVVHWDDPVAAKVQQVIDDKISPSVGGHGGWVELLAVDGDTAVIQFGGGCQGCGMSQVTLKEGIERMILEDVPEIKKVVDDTDHAAGTNPYYAG